MTTLTHVELVEEFRAAVQSHTLNPTNSENINRKLRANDALLDALSQSTKSIHKVKFSKLLVEYLDLRDDEKVADWTNHSRRERITELLDEMDKLIKVPSSPVIN